MEKLKFSIAIKASKQKVWETMLNDVTYRQWTAVFNPSGSYYEGSWEAGSEIKFLGPDKDGTVSGMIAKIAESRPYDFISIQHLGEVIQNQTRLWSASDTGGEAVHENYTFTQLDGGPGTELVVELDTTEAFKEMFAELWPKALLKLKELAERH
jgi:uncharacterized protein YndB with AHSA1/START domain